MNALSILEDLRREVEIPVVAGPQAQGDLIVVPLHLLDDVHVPAGARWRPVPPEGVELLRGADGGNPHTLVADAGTAQWTADVRDAQWLAIGVVRATGTAYLIHPEHGGSGIVPGTYLIRRQREGTGRPEPIAD